MLRWELKDSEKTGTVVLQTTSRHWTMEGKIISRSVNSNCSDIGTKQIVSSFVSVNNNENGFGTFRVPESFHRQYGRNICGGVVIYCSISQWKAKYDIKLRTLYGLRRLISFYGVSTNNLMQFDYYGDNIFVIRIFKDNAVESSYEPEVIDELLPFSDAANWKRDKTVLDHFSLEFEKSYALWLFNAYRNNANYFEVEIKNVNIDQNLGNLVLEAGLEKNYKDWNNGEEITLMFVSRGWNILIKRDGERCEFDKGWQRFKEAVELEAGDRLVLYQLNNSSSKFFNVCIFKAADKIGDYRTDDDCWNVSFVKVVSETSEKEGMLVVPLCIKEAYGDLLSKVNQVEIAGERKFLFYSYIGGYLANIFQILKHFHVSPKETIIFTIHKYDVLQGRVYTVDGMEIDYSERLKGSGNAAADCWIWFVHKDSEAGENVFWEGGEEDDINHSQQIGKNEVNPELDCFGHFMIAMKQEFYERGEMKLPEDFILKFGSALPSAVTLQFPTGLEKHVLYNHLEQSFVVSNYFLKELMKYSASILVLRYRGNGMFSVHALNDNGSEVEYDVPRSKGRNRLNNIETNGVFGRKFCAVGVGGDFDVGEVEIPETFLSKFGNVVPDGVRFVLSNGFVFNGGYVKDKRKLNGLNDIIDLGYFKRKDTLLFTYVGDGKFNVIVFNSAKIEKYFPASEKEEGNHSGLQNETETSVPPLEENNSEMEHEVHEPEVVDEEMIDAGEHNDLNEDFTVLLTKSNINKSTHGVYIPRSVTPQNRHWISGEKVELRTTAGSWTVGVVVSGHTPRFSAGWNKFAKDNKLKVNQHLVFTMNFEAGGIVFDVQRQ